jgi:hypothetical protein
MIWGRMCGVSSFHRLPDAHATLRDRLGFLQRGYVRWNFGMMKKLATGA